jgi:AhpD family alkylhydroperoxidase
MDEKTRELAAIAAAVAGKCQPCFAYHFKQAQKLGIPDEQIRGIIQLAKDIRASGNKHMDEFAERRMKETEETTR